MSTERVLIIGRPMFSVAWQPKHSRLRCTLSYDEPRRRDDARVRRRAEFGRRRSTLRSADNRTLEVHEDRDPRGFRS